MRLFLLGISTVSPVRRNFAVFHRTYAIYRMTACETVSKILRVRRYTRWQASCSSLSASFSLTLKYWRRATMKRTSLILIAAFALVMLPAAFGQGTPSQSQDPNAAQPTATPSQQTPSAQPSTTPSTSDPTSSAAAASTDAPRSFVGSIMKTGVEDVLHTGGTDHLPYAPTPAGQVQCKDLNVTR